MHAYFVCSDVNELHTTATVKLDVKIMSIHAETGKVDYDFTRCHLSTVCTVCSSLGFQS